MIRRWGDEVVVYDDATGSMQMWNTVASEVFEMLLKHGRLSEQQIAAALMPGEEPAGEDVVMVRDLLRQLQTMGLVECPLA